MVKIKRIYEPWSPEDGFRVLVDRLWPRGMSKEKAHVDLWLKDIAPSARLRKWFGHDPEKWEEFGRKYRQELLEKKQYVDELKTLGKKHSAMTLLYAAQDTEHNEAIILAHILTRHLH